MDIQAKISYTCRQVSFDHTVVRQIPAYVPKSGDVGLFRVLSLGKHTRIHNEDGINRSIFVGDEIVATFGNRYASNQFEGRIQPEPQAVYDLLGQGGVVGTMAHSHAKFERTGTTQLALEGFVTNSDGSTIINTHQSLPNPCFKDLARPPKIILSVGSSMDSGKTTTAAYLAKGIRAMGYRPAYIKLTGTAYAKDAFLVSDLGAVIARDFSHFGYPSTYLYDVEELIDLFHALLAEVRTENPDYVIVEIADGIVQRETKALLTHPTMHKLVDGMILSVGDSLGALGSLSVLEKMNWQPLALAGCLTAAPLMVLEAQAFTSLPILTLKELATPDSLVQFLPQVLTPALVHKKVA